MMTDTSTEAWERIGREAVAERIEADAHDIDETFEAIAAAIRRGEELTQEDVRMMRHALTLAEYHLDDVLEPLANGDGLRDDVAILEGCGDDPR